MSWQAGVQNWLMELDSRFRRNDGVVDGLGNRLDASLLGKCQPGSIEGLVARQTSSCP